MDGYTTFLEGKFRLHVPTGIESPVEIHPKLKDFQRLCVQWALRRGRSALFHGTGLGKTIQQVEFARHVEAHTQKPVLIVAPLAVAEQTIEEAQRHIGLAIKFAASDADVAERGVYITNYEKLHKFNPERFAGLILDEGSRLKSVDSATSSLVIESFKNTPFKLVCTATPAPNDISEIGGYSEFLGVMSTQEMLATFFINDTGDTSKWRLKRHAEKEFYRWMASWAACLRMPSDIGCDDSGYILPPLKTHEVIVESKVLSDGELFAKHALTLDERRGARRDSITERVQAAMDIVISKPGKQFVIWCGLNSEQDAMAKALGSDCVSIQGSTPDDAKVIMYRKWRAGEVPIMVTKCEIFGSGLNMQQSSHAIFLGLSDSFERFYQGIRRQWRFGQDEEVNAYIVISEAEGAVLKNIKRKQTEAEKMQASLVSHMAEFTKRELGQQARETLTYNPTQKIILPKWL